MSNTNVVGGSRRSLYGLLVTSVISVAGTRISAIAIPWFVLTTTGSPTKMGLVLLFEMLPYVVVKALGGPMIDRRGPRQVSIFADATSAVVAALIPILYLTGQLSFPVLLVLVAVLGTVRGPGDAAKFALVPQVARESGMSLERVTGLESTADRTTSIISFGIAGGLVAIVGPINAVIVDAASFAFAAIALAVTVSRRPPLDEPGHLSEAAYLHRLAEGARFLRGDRLLSSVVAMVATTNWLDAAYAAVLLPVWIHDHGYDTTELGLIGMTFALTATGGSLIATAMAGRLPRRLVFLGGFLLCGAPRFLVLALDAPIWGILMTVAIGGFGAGFINPVLGAIFYERVPPHLIGRVSALEDSLCWAGVPLGGVSAAAAIAAFGLAPALVIAGGIYFAATLVPGLRPEWKEMNRSDPADVPSQIEEPDESENVQQEVG
jgi:MFS family permease